MSSIFFFILFVLNLLFGITDIQRGNCTKTSALTWFALGVLVCSFIVTFTSVY